MTTADQTGEIPQFTIDTLKLEDITSLQEVLATWVRDSETHALLEDEIAEINTKMRDSIDKNNGYRFFVVRDMQNIAVGMMGIRKPEEQMMPFTTTQNPVELINIYISQSVRGQGVGKAFIQEVSKRAQEMGYTELILNSGPRYKDSAWGFYDRIFGKPFAIAQNYYGVGYDTPVWRKLF